MANGHPVFDTRIFVKEARSLVRAGYAVTIIVPAETSEIRDGVSILPVPVRIKGWQKLFVNPWVIFRKALTRPTSAIFCIHDSDILIAGVALKVLGRRVVYDAHEDTPLQISYQHWLPPLIKKIYGAFYYVLEKLCGWIFDRIIVAEPVIARYFPKGKTKLVRNFPVAEAFRSHVAIPYQERKARLSYVGSLTAVRGLFEMVEAAKRASSAVSFEFLLGGGFSPAHLKEKIVAEYNVNFIGWVSHAQLVDVLFDSRAGIIVPHPVERYKTNYPVKLFEYMAAGIPVIASSEGESAAFVRESRCGILVDPKDVDQIAEAIVWIFTHPEEAAEMGQRGQQLIFDRYNWEKEADELVRLYDNLTARRS